MMYTHHHNYGTNRVATCCGKALLFVIASALSMSLTSAQDDQCLRGLAPVKECMDSNSIKPQVYVSYIRLPSYNFYPLALKEQCQRRDQLNNAQKCINDYIALCRNQYNSRYLDLLVNSLNFHQGLCDEEQTLDVECFQILNAQRIYTCALENANAITEGIPYLEKQCEISGSSFECAWKELDVCDSNTAAFFRRQRDNFLQVICPR